MRRVQFIVLGYIFKLFLRIFKSIFFLSGLIFSFFLNLATSLYCYKTIKIYWCNHLNRGIVYLYKKHTIFPHPIGIVIGFNVELGDNCIIYQNVTIGAKDTKHYSTAPYPKIGNNVTIYPNSIIFGDVTIGENSVIGAGSVIFKDIPPNSVAVGNPCRILQKNDNLSL